MRPVYSMVALLMAVAPVACAQMPMTGKMAPMSEGSSMMGMMNMMGGSMMGNYQPYSPYSNYGYWSLFQIVFLVVSIIFIALLAYKFGVQKAVPSESWLSIVKKRFARGEITKRQFYEMKRDLEE